METIVAKINDEFSIEIPFRFGRYEFIRTIGNGAFSVVALVYDITTNAQYACKISSRKFLIQQKLFDKFEREVRIMQSFQSPFLVQLYDIVYDQNLIYLIMEYCSNGELFQAIADNGPVEEKRAKKIFAQIVSGVSYIHSHDISHRDIKPENILLDSCMNAKITDFGLCQHTSENLLLKTYCGSPFYVSPEVLLNKPYDGKKSDIWSLGVVLFTIVTGGLPWEDIGQQKLYQQIAEANFTIPRYLPPDLRDLISRLMQLNPKDRPNVDEILKHPWLADVVGELATQPMNSGIETLSSNRGSQQFLRKNIIVRPKVQRDCGFISSSFGAKFAPVQKLIRKVPTRRRHLSGRANPTFKPVT
ncbi:CAMK family protein kinase [Histomonas meleagridis]|uniref:CAMK family protein kinase n=1 Tax=Histomonas meleagridis TaxID=135588 RepID=UPI00355A7008|nr:CAMK family protein kinase [Histomonas meleagridis]KAH0796531.1 CAMK family protein kinase [Histomonas meleagridis]